MRDLRPVAAEAPLRRALPVLGSLATAAILLAPRALPSDALRIATCAVLALFMAGVLAWARQRPAPWPALAVAFLAFAVVQLLNAIVQWGGVHLLHDPPVNGDPLAGSVWGTVLVQLAETMMAIVPVVVVTRAAGWTAADIYARTWRMGGAFAVAVLAFFLMLALEAVHPPTRLFPMQGTMDRGRLASLLPALVLLALANGFQEEFLFRGLFLKAYDAALGARAALWLQAVVFAGAHFGVTYTPVIAVFTLVFILPLGLLTGWMMRRSDGVLAPAILHAAVDIPIYLAFLTYAS